MYGMVNQAVKGLVENRFGEAAWRAIHTAADAPETFAVMQPYDDDVTYRLVAAASDALALPAADVLRVFGEYWVLNVAAVHYASLMSGSGVDFVDFLKNLDHMHQRIRVTFPNYHPPSFRVVETGPGLLQVDYYSHREGLLPFVEGLFTGLGKHFGVQVTFEHIPDDSHPLPCKRIVVHHCPA